MTHEFHEGRGIIVVVCSTAELLRMLPSAVGPTAGRPSDIGRISAGPRERRRQGGHQTVFPSIIQVFQGLMCPKSAPGVPSKSPQQSLVFPDSPPQPFPSHRLDPSQRRGHSPSCPGAADTPAVSPMLGSGQFMEFSHPWVSSRRFNLADCMPLCLEAEPLCPVEILCGRRLDAARKKDCCGPPHRVRPLRGVEMPPLKCANGLAVGDAGWVGSSKDLDLWLSPIYPCLMFTRLGSMRGSSVQWACCSMVRMKCRVCRVWVGPCQKGTIGSARKEAFNATGSCSHTAQIDAGNAPRTEATERRRGGYSRCIRIDASLGRRCSRRTRGVRPTGSSRGGCGPRMKGPALCPPAGRFSGSDELGKPIGPCPDVTGASRRRGLHNALRESVGRGYPVAAATGYACGKGMRRAGSEPN